MAKANYTDSLGNKYWRILSGAKPTPGPKKTHSAPVPRKSSKHRTPGGETKHSSKYHRYRVKRGRPNGPGMPGAKSGKKKVRS